MRTLGGRVGRRRVARTVVDFGSSGGKRVLRLELPLGGGSRKEVRMQRGLCFRMRLWWCADLVEVGIGEDVVPEKDVHEHVCVLCRQTAPTDMDCQN